MPQVGSLLGDQQKLERSPAHSCNSLGPDLPLPRGCHLSNYRGGKQWSTSQISCPPMILQPWHPEDTLMPLTWASSASSERIAGVECDMDHHIILPAARPLRSGTTSLIPSQDLVCPPGRLDSCLDPLLCSRAQAPAFMCCPSLLTQFSSGSLLLSPPHSSPREPALISDLPPRCLNFCPLVSGPNPDGPTQSILGTCD